MRCAAVCCTLAIRTDPADPGIFRDPTFSKVARTLSGYITGVMTNLKQAYIYDLRELMYQCRTALQ
jgi:hypothetical protein